MSVTAESADQSSSYNCPPVVATVCTDRGVYSGKLVSESAAADAGMGGSRRTSVAPGVDSADPAVRRVVYNLYRGLLGTYNDKANDIISSMPAERVREDQGIAKQVESMA